MIFLAGRELYAIFKCLVESDQAISDKKDRLI